MRGIKPFMDWVGRQDDVFGFINSGTLQKNNPQLTEDRGGSASLILTHLDTSDLGDSRKTEIFSPVNHSSNPASYGYISTNLHAYDCKFQQRMTADAPYNSSTAKFSPNQTYPISMLYRYRNTIQDDASKLRTKEAVKGRRYYGSSTANFTPPLFRFKDEFLYRFGIKLLISLIISLRSVESFTNREPLFFGIKLASCFGS